MKNLITYKIFEAVSKLHPDAEEFLEEIEKSPYKKILDSWFTFTPRKTGRITIKGQSMPSQAWFEKNGTGNWYYTYSASGRYYGRQDGDLQYLFINLIKDAIKKGAPSYLNRKDLKDALDDNDWFFSNIDSDYSGIFKKIKDKILGESGIVDNFNNLDLPFLNRLQELGLAKVDNGKLGEMYVKLIDNLENASANSLNTEHWQNINRILEGQKNLTYTTRLDKYRFFAFYPKGNGVKVKTYEKEVNCQIGLSDEQEVAQKIHDIIKKYTEKSRIRYRNLSGISSPSDEAIEIVNILYHSLLDSALNTENTKIETTLDDYFKKNPLELYILDSVPQMKADIIRRTGIKDLSNVGSLLARNMF